MSEVIRQFVNLWIDPKNGAKFFRLSAAVLFAILFFFFADWAKSMLELFCYMLLGGMFFSFLMSAIDRNSFFFYTAALVTLVLAVVLKHYYPRELHYLALTALIFLCGFGMLLELIKTLSADKKIDWVSVGALIVGIGISIAISVFFFYRHDLVVRNNALIFGGYFLAYGLLTFGSIRPGRR